MSRALACAFSCSNRPRRWWSGLLAGMLAALLWAGSARADGPTQANGPDWALGHPAGEALIGGLSALSLLAAALPQQASSWEPSSDRPRDDRYGLVSDFTGAGIGSTWQILAGWALDVGYYEQHRVGEPYGLALRSSLVDLEAVMLATGLTFTLKRLTGRCRPRAWITRPDGTGACRSDHPEHDAFPSGHVAAVGSVAGSRLLLAVRSTGEVERRYVAFGLAEGSTLATAALRVLAGAHSWEDVLGGWAIGHGAGALLSLLHPMVAAETAEGDDGVAVGAAPVSFTYNGSF